MDGVLHPTIRGWERIIQEIGIASEHSKNPYNGKSARLEQDSLELPSECIGMHRNASERMDSPIGWGCFHYVHSLFSFVPSEDFLNRSSRQDGKVRGSFVSFFFLSKKQRGKVMGKRSGGRKKSKRSEIGMELQSRWAVQQNFWTHNLRLYVSHRERRRERERRSTNNDSEYRINRKEEKKSGSGGTATRLWCHRRTSPSIDRNRPSSLRRLTSSNSISGRT